MMDVPHGQRRIFNDLLTSLREIPKERLESCGF